MTPAAPGRADVPDTSAATLPTEMAIPSLASPESSRVRQAPSSSGEPSSSSSLPSDVVEETGRRLSIAMLVVAAVDLVYVILYSTVWAEYADLPGEVSGGGTLILSLLGSYALRKCPRSQREVFTIAMVYEALIAFGFSLNEFWSLPHFDRAVTMVSWTCVLIAVFPVLVPAPTRRMALCSFGAAAMHTLAFVLAVPIRGEPMPAMDVMLSMLMPPYLAAAVSIVPAQVFHRLGRQVGQARELGSYRLVEKLGAGGMGEVWRAEHRLLARPAAIKLIRNSGDAADIDGRRRLIERFEREAQATAALESPHTVELYDFGVSDRGVFYYVMEILRGIDLESLVARFGPQPPERVAQILLEACDSLEDAHQAGLIHRDVKPANMFLTSRAQRVDFLKVLDFGLVKIVSQPAPGQDDLKLSRVGEVHGTPAYMAPEEASGDAQAQPASDLYSLGCVAYWLLTGKLVFDETSSLKMVIAHATRDAIAPSRIARQEIPPALDELVLRCLAKSPADRPGSAAELARAIQAANLASAWTQDRARAWWRQHLPDRLPSAQARSVPSMISRRSVQFSIDSGR